MKAIIKKTFFLTFALPYTTSALSCPVNGDRPTPNLWVCEFNAAMEGRDKEADYTRHADLISTPLEIKKVRASISVLDDETCRRSNKTSLVSSFHRILQHQSLPRSLLDQISKAAAAEILEESSTGRVDVCESQYLSSERKNHTYQNLYYFKFGPLRENKHFVIQVTTKWQN